jgi:hypothetical protein
VAAKALVLGGIAAAVLVAGPGASPAAAQLWSAPMDLGAGNALATGDVDVEADGKAVVAWTAGGEPVRAALRSTSGEFGPATTLAPDGGAGLAVAADGAGGALVAWSRNGTLGLAERTAGASRLTDVATGLAGVASGPDVAFIGPGQALVVWAGTDGAVHALSRTLGGSTVPLPDLAAGPGNVTAHVGAAGGHAVAAWTHAATGAMQTTTHVRAAVMPPGGAFGAAEDLASATWDTSMPNWSGSQVTAQRVVVSGSGDADVLLTELHAQGPPGEVALGGKVAARTMGGWALAHTSPLVDGPSLNSGMYVADVATGPAGDAMYAEGFKAGGLPPMDFAARLRSAGAGTYGGATALHPGVLGEVRAAPLSAGRYLVLVRSGSELRSRAGNPAIGFDDPLVFSGTDGARLLGLAGAPSGIAAAAWVTTGNRVHAAIYGDPDADTTDPRLTRLSVSPKRFAVRRRSRTATRIRWRLSERARVTLRVDRARPGFRRGGRCVARRPRAGRIRRCTRYTRVGSFTRTRDAGTARLRFNGHLRGRALRSGPHRLTATPSDMAGNRGNTRRTSFRVQRRG